MSPSSASRTPDSSADMVFEHTMRGLLDVAGPELSPDLKARLVAAGVDPDALLPAYGTAIYGRVLELVRQALFADRSPEEGNFAIGRAFFQRYERTLMGRAVLVAIRVLGARRMLDRMSRNFRTANNYTETRVTELGTGDCEVWFNRIIEPHYYRGLLTEALSRAGSEQYEVLLQSHGPDGAVFRLRWS